MIKNKSSKINKKSLINKIETSNLKTNIPNFRVGDFVKLGIEIKEGQKTRIQAYDGLIISKRGESLNKTIVVRRVISGIGIERCFLVFSPKIKFFEIKRSSKVRRAKLYYLRALTGKSARLKKRFD